MERLLNSVPECILLRMIRWMSVFGLSPRISEGCRLTAGPMGATVFFCTGIIATAILFWPGSSLKKKTGEHIFLESRAPNIPEKLLWQICSGFGNLSRFGRAARGRATSDIGIHFWLDEARPCEAFDIRGASMAYLNGRSLTKPAHAKHLTYGVPAWHTLTGEA